ncbi:MAG: hypothetical protein K2X90_00905 [Candidatus Babeliaceae bacterium]|nr:hypothetical protein [Candidatus Babeliaceae bacterium]
MLILLPILLNGQYGVIKTRILEMNNSFPSPDKPAASPDTHRCPRAHQGLFNELIRCVEEKDDHIKVNYDNIIYRIDNKPSTFWTYKNDIIPLSELEKRNMLYAIPHPEYAQEPTIVLTYPWNNFSL